MRFVVDEGRGSALIPVASLHFMSTSRGNFLVECERIRRTRMSRDSTWQKLDDY